MPPDASKPGRYQSALHAKLTGYGRQLALRIAVRAAAGIRDDAAGRGAAREGQPRRARPGARRDAGFAVRTAPRA